MARKSNNRTLFKSEAEEADWYATPAGRRQTAREFERALRQRKLTRLQDLGIPRSDPRLLERLMKEAKQNATRAISIRIPIADLERAQQIAAQTGEGYQTILKRAIRAGLKRAG